KPLTLIAASAMLAFSSVSAFSGGNAFLLTGIGWTDPDSGTNMYFYDSHGRPASYRYYSSNSFGIDDRRLVYVSDNQGHILSAVGGSTSYSSSNQFFPAYTNFYYEWQTNTFEHGDLVRSVHLSEI